MFYSLMDAKLAFPVLAATFRLCDDAGALPAARGPCRLMASANSNQAFIDEGLRVQGAKHGPLAGLTVAVKDLFDVRHAPTAASYTRQSPLMSGLHQ